MSVVLPEIGGITIYPPEGHELTQTYQNEEGSEIMRMLQGSGIKQFHWSKLKTTISGTGFVPTALNDLSFQGSYTLKCAAAKSARDVDVTVELPAARRTDVTSCAFGVLSDGTHVPTSVNIVTNTATCGSVTNAVEYRVWYYPQVTVFAVYSEDISRDQATWSWSLECEEV